MKLICYDNTITSTTHSQQAELWFVREKKPTLVRPSLCWGCSELVHGSLYVLLTECCLAVLVCYPAVRSVASRRTWTRNAGWHPAWAKMTPGAVDSRHCAKITSWQEMHCALLLKSISTPELTFIFKKNHPLTIIFLKTVSPRASSFTTLMLVKKPGLISHRFKTIFLKTQG